MMTKIIKVGNSLGIIIPRSLMKSLGWKTGTQVEFEPIDKNSFLIFKKGTRGKKDIIEFYKFIRDFDKKYGHAMEELAKK